MKGRPEEPEPTHTAVGAEGTQPLLADVPAGGQLHPHQSRRCAEPELPLDQPDGALVCIPSLAAHTVEEQEPPSQRNDSFAPRLSAGLRLAANAPTLCSDGGAFARPAGRAGAGVHQ